VRIGVFGGTFDPPHIGHLILADEACQQLNLDHVLWVPTARPPHKLEEEITSIQQRVDLVEAAIHNNDRFILSRIDIDRPPPHYAVDTMGLLKAIDTSSELIYLMGGDSLVNLSQWHRPMDFVADCSGLGVMRRAGAETRLAEIEHQIPGISEKVSWIETPLIEISAHEIRSRIRNGLSYRYYLPSVVYNLVEERGLYRDP
jgi:nicotinate-nucleotide adenylyltransferase